MLPGAKTARVPDFSGDVEQVCDKILNKYAKIFKKHQLIL